MRTQRIIIDLLCAAVCFSAVASALAEPASPFAKANEAYAQGQYKEAIGDYESLASSGEWNANLFYNLGNAYFRAGDFGRAILNYERALALDRHHPESEANLRIARDEARALEMQQSWLERHLEFASLNQFSVAAAVAFWAAVYCVAGLILAHRRSGRLIALSILSALIFAGVVFAIFIIHKEGKGLAIVTGREVNARLATADNASSVLALPAGSEIKILSWRGDWIYAALPNNLRGWIPAKEVEQVPL